MALLVVGSHALNKYQHVRTPMDMDLIGDVDEATEFLKMKNCVSIYPIEKGKKLFGRSKESIYEIELTWPDNLADQLLKRAVQHNSVVSITEPFEIIYADLDTLYTLKMSHRYLKNSPHFYKTRKDIMLMRTLGAQIPSDLKDWYVARQKETYSYKLPNLNQDKMGFFQDQYKYDHDSLHKAVKFGDWPAYQQFAEPGAEVKSSKALWDKCNHYTKINAGVEEASVLALERSLVPHPGAWSEDKAFKFALMKVCTSITSGWFREFCWEHMEEIEAKYQERANSGWGLLRLLECGIADGRVKLNEAYQEEASET